MILRTIRLIPAFVIISLYKLLGLPHGNESNIPLSKLFMDAIKNG